jgi:hypothetical protein
MRQALIPLVAGLAIGLVVSSGLVAYRGAAPAALADGLAEASAARPGGAGVEVMEVEGGEEVVLAAADEPEPPEGTDTLALAAAIVSTGAAVVVPAGLPAAPGAINGATMETARLAKLFGSMPVRDAASVLEHMDDHEVQVILGQLGNREAAAILGSLPPQRAAAISRTVIRGERSTP